MVLVSRAEKIKIYTYLLQEGVFCCKKDYTSKNAILEIPNINCFLVLRSLKSRKFTTEIFSWQWHYYFLTTEGVKYLREYLGLPGTVIPNTHKFENVQQPEEKPEEGNEDRRPRVTRGKTRGTGRGRREETEN